MPPDDNKPMMTNNELYEKLVSIESKLDTHLAKQGVYNRMLGVVAMATIGLIAGYIRVMLTQV